MTKYELLMSVLEELRKEDDAFVGSEGWTSVEPVVPDFVEDIGNIGESLFGNEDDFEVTSITKEVVIPMQNGQCAIVTINLETGDEEWETITYN